MEYLSSRPGINVRIVLFMKYTYLVDTKVVSGKIRSSSYMYCLKQTVI